MGYNIGPALSIFHSIPLAKRAMLLPEQVLEEYGYNDRWWSGEAIEAPRIVNLESDRVGPEIGDVVVETQRLMAFLECTNRAYGSVDSLAKLPSMPESQEGRKCTQSSHLYTT